MFIVVKGEISGGFVLKDLKGNLMKFKDINSGVNTLRKYGYNTEEISRYVFIDTLNFKFHILNKDLINKIPL